jgi:hypothetical protein
MKNLVKSINNLGSKPCFKIKMLHKNNEVPYYSTGPGKYYV